MRAAVAQIVGEENALGDAPVVARPADVAQVAAVVRLAHERGLRVLPRGGGTRQGSASFRADIVLDTTRLARIATHSPEDLVASVECGVRWHDLQSALGEKGQRIPLDPPAGGASTFGGVLSTGAFGPLRLRHGTLRDRVIGTTLVRFDGEVVQSGGMVVKNVSGYDLGKLYLDARGSLGILVRANLKLAPVPTASWGVTTPAADPESTWREFADTWNSPTPLVAAVACEGRLTLGFEAEVAAGSEAFPTLPDWVATGRSVTRLHYPPTAWPRIARALPEGRNVSLLGSGVTWVNGGAARELQAIAAAHDGFAVVERGDGATGVVPSGAATLMAGIKAALDPKSIFPPVPGTAS